MSKWNSRRWWVCLWAMAMCTAIMVMSLILKVDLQWFGSAIALFQLIIVGYIAADTYTKPKP